MRDTLQVLLALLVVATAVGMLAKRLRVHYNIALVLTGVALGAAHVLPGVTLRPQIVLDVFLPILLFEAATATDVRRLRDNLAPVVLLAMPGTALTMLVAGAVLRVGLGLEWPLALLLGAMLASTDTIATIASFRQVRAPARLSTIVENESLFNDATALVAFATLLEVVLSGRFDPQTGFRDLAWLTVAGLAAGVAVGRAASLLMHRTEDHLIEIMMTVAVTYGSHLLAISVGGSPVLAVVAAGLVVGSTGWSGLTATSKVAIRSVWAVAAFGVNTVVFLLVGLQVDPRSLLVAAPAVGWGMLAITAGRVASVYPFMALVRALGTEVPARWQHLLVWANLKGSLAMALAVSLPADVPQRQLLLSVVFGCALVTLTVQGLTLASVARGLGLGRLGDAERRRHREQARLLAARAAQAELERLQRQGLLATTTFQRLRAGYQAHIADAERAMRDLLAVDDEQEPRHSAWVKRHLATVEKSALAEAVGSGLVDEESVREIQEKLDEQLAALEAVERERD
jgi:CPA1 family monovalent cation:H+ antiporter